jgi:hypothetical protein
MRKRRFICGMGQEWHCDRREGGDETLYVCVFKSVYIHILICNVCAFARTCTCIAFDCYLRKEWY